MIKAINTIINRSGYPVFTPNQVLTKDDLNHLVNYLDEQNRLTRAYLIGVGIVCGLEVSSTYETAQAQIQISAGCGITSEGYAIALADTTLNHYQPEQLVSAALFAPSQKQYKVIELFAQSGDKNIPLHKAADGSLRDEKAFQEFLSDRVLVVVCELQDVQRDNCRLDYNNLSQERSLLYRFFLLPRTQKPDTDEEAIAAETLLQQGFQVDQLPSYWQGLGTEAVFTARNHYLQEFDHELQQFRDFAPKVQRFGYSQSEQVGKSVDLTKISDYKAFRDNYYLVCQNAIAAIDNAFPKLFRLFSPFFSSFQPNSADDFSNLKQRLELLLEAIKPQEIRQQTVPSEKVEPTYALQYFYDYLSQLVAAYDELAEAAFDLMDDCAPDTQRFPKFLMLGIVPSPNQALKGYEPASAYRSHFTQPPIYNGNQLRVKQVRHLCDRLLNLCQENSFYLLPFSATPLKITPSKDSSVPLSEQAIPYYLNYPQIYRYWSYDAYRKGRSHLLPAYFTLKEDDKTASIPKRDDLVYRLDGQNFYRIEGHIGKANGDALKRIQEYQRRYNLAFDVITLKLGSEASLQDLNISGQFDDLESDFRRMKETFEKLWIKYATEPKNAFLQTLKQVFFGQPSLTVINSSQLFNPILEMARKPEAYEFVQENATQRYRLFVRDKTNQQIARYVTQAANTEGNNLNDFNTLSIDFSGLTDDDINKEKQRIIKEIADCLSLGKITYEIVSDSSKNYHLKLSTEYQVNLPPGDPSRTYSIVLLSLNHFAVSFDKNNSPIIQQPDFQDVETLYSLLRDVPATFNTDEYQMGNSQAAEELNYFELIGLIEAYQRRLEQLMKLHLFNKFVEQHPGVEHLGGVPKGGTFILVYVDGQEVDELLVADKDPAIYKLLSLRTAAIEKTAAFPPAAPQEVISSWEKLFPELQKRKDVVVGDFCLPYRCSSDAPAVSYVLARPRPIILLEKTVFCEDDSNKYQFTLEPEGGTVRGEGILFEGIKQLFQPSSIGQASKDELAKGSEIAITFAYAVDDTYDTLTVTIYPKPQANLSITQSQHFCHNAGAFEIALAEGTPENVELIQVSIDGKDTRILDTSQYATTNQPQQVTIAALIRDRRTQCENTVTRTVTVNSSPEAELSVTQGQSFCHNAELVEITLAAGTPENIELIQVSINGTDTRILDISQYATGSQPQQVTIAAQIRDRQTQCENTLTRTITVNPLPAAELSITEDQTFCQNAGVVEITLAAGTAENVELIQVSIDGKETRILDTSQYATGSQQQQVTITAQIRDHQTQCENTLTRTITVHPLPAAELSITEGDNFCHNSGVAEITLAEGTPENVELIQVSINGTETRILDTSQYATASQPQEVTITALIRDRQTQCGNTLTRTITVHPLPAAELSITEGDNFCHNSGVAEITLAAGTSENVELIQVSIDGKETRILDTSQYATGSQPETVTIVALIRDRQTQCGNTLTRTITVSPLPVAELSINEGENFCHNAGVVEITLAEGTPENIELTKVSIDGTDTRILDPKQFATGSQPQEVKIEAQIRDRQTQCENTLSRTVTVNPLPEADFQAEIANINAQGFSIRVFNIQPPETSFSFVWEHPGGSLNTSNPGNSEFIISYNYDFNNWVAGAEVSITLRVNTPPTLGSCSSEPITKKIAIPSSNMVGFNLLTISNSQVLKSAPLESDNTFRLSEFNPNNEYAIEAVTVPATVDRIVFTYTAPGDDAKSSTQVNPLYHLPDGWQTIVGVHTITAQSFKELNGTQVESVASTVIIRITDSEADTPTATPSTPSATLLNRLRVLFQMRDGHLTDIKPVNRYREPTNMT
ncbi:hypothetical protein [Nostoc sp. 106C]|uniref:hypothetical protein n=1 Tax=Nostoc sp. 106C TaxID=1932667 RepID=UPI000A3CCC37|nr:hypothetical protein [Nostoc sp. 106C]OUL35161.1 hypothetical protein BV375_02610 [Nostoc sp. 106C]